MSREFTVTDDSRGDWHRNIVTLRTTVDLFGDLVGDPKHIPILIAHEIATKLTTTLMPIVNRPFEDAQVYDLIQTTIDWPFEHLCRSRYSSGRFGVWYGAGALETSVRETVHHFKVNTLASQVSASSRVPIVQERRVHLVHCNALLVDLRELCRTETRLLDGEDYSFCNALGAQLREALQPGVITRSARHEDGTVIGVFTREALSDPRTLCYLTYSLDAATGRVSVERTPGAIEWVI